MRLLITGAAGGIGQALRSSLSGSYQLLRLADLKTPSGPLGANEELINFDITDLEAATSACQGIDCVVHMAGISDEPQVDDPWAELLPANIIGTYNLFEAARRAGVKRFIYASSNHAVGFYRRGKIIDATALPRPSCLYGVTKVFGEALGRLYADKHGMSVACLRIGSFRPEPENRRQLYTWISPEDMVLLVKRCIDTPNFHYVVAYGVSKIDGAFWSNRGIEWLDFNPASKIDAYSEHAKDWPEEDELAHQFHGGGHCALYFDGDSSLID
jgi:uronate dehydrogenase